MHSIINELKQQLVKCLEMREKLGETVNGVKQPWTDLDEDIEQLRDMIAEMEAQQR